MSQEVREQFKFVLSIVPRYYKHSSKTRKLKTFSVFLQTELKQTNKQTKQNENPGLYWFTSNKLYMFYIRKFRTWCAQVQVSFLTGRCFQSSQLQRVISRLRHKCHPFSGMEREVDLPPPCCWFTTSLLLIYHLLVVDFVLSALLDPVKPEQSIGQTVVCVQSSLEKLEEKRRSDRGLCSVKSRESRREA